MPRELLDRAREYLGMIPPFMRDAAVFQAIYNAAAGEDELQQQMLDDLEAQLIPATATDLLSLWEAELRINVAPEGATVEQRRDAVLAFLRNMTSQGSGLEWSEAAYKLLGTGFTYQKHNHSENRVWDPSFEVPIVPDITPGVTANSVANPSFEIDTNSWSTAANNQIVAGATLTRVADGGAGIAGSNFAGEVVATAADQGVSVVVGGFDATKTTKFRVRLKRMSGPGTITISYLSGDGVRGGVVFSGLAPAEWTEFVGQFVQGPELQTYRLIIKASGAATFRIDALLAMTTTANLPAYFDGSTGPPGSYTVWSQPSLPHQSTSLIYQLSPWMREQDVRGPASLFSQDILNFIPNPRFANDTTGWSATAGATLSRVTTEARFGSASAQVVTAGAGAGEGIRTSNTDPGSFSAFVPTVWVKAPAGAAMSLVFEERTQLDAFVGSNVTNFTGTGAWQSVVGSVRTFTSGNVFRVAVQNNGTAARTFWVGAVMLNPGAAWSFYFDGSLMDVVNNNGLVAYASAWNGTAHLTASRLVRTRKNAGWSNGTFGTRETTTGWASRGTQSLRLTNPAAAGTAYATSPYFPVTPGKSYSVRQTRKVNAMPASAASGWASAYLFFEDVNGSTFASFAILPNSTGGNGLAPAAQATPYDDSRVIQAPAGAVRAFLALGVGNPGGLAANSVDVQFDAVMVAEGVNADNSALAYGDGDQQGWAWDGPAQQGFDEFNSSTIIGPPPNTIWAFVPFGEGSIAAQLAQTLLRAITPANTEINVSYGGGFILDLSQLDDDLL